MDTIRDMIQYAEEFGEQSMKKLNQMDPKDIFKFMEKGYNVIVRVEHYTDLSNVLFKTHALAEKAIKILGEETVKLALEPLY